MRGKRRDIERSSIPWLIANAAIAEPEQDQSQDQEFHPFSPCEKVENQAVLYQVWLQEAASKGKEGLSLRYSDD